MILWGSVNIQFPNALHPMVLASIDDPFLNQLLLCELKNSDFHFFNILYLSFFWKYFLFFILLSLLEYHYGLTFFFFYSIFIINYQHYLFQHFIVKIFKHKKRWKNFIANTYILTTSILQLIFYYTCFRIYLFVYATPYPPINFFTHVTDILYMFLTFWHCALNPLLNKNFSSNGFEVQLWYFSYIDIYIRICFLKCSFNCLNILLIISIPY